MTTTHHPRYAEAAIEADPTVPAIHITRDFAATPAQLFRAHTDPEVFAQWIGPRDIRLYEREASGRLREPSEQMIRRAP